MASEVMPIVDKTATLRPMYAGGHWAAGGSEDNTFRHLVVLDTTNHDVIAISNVPKTAKDRFLLTATCIASHSQ